MAGTRYDNIDSSAFKRGEYVGYGRGTVWRIRKTGREWEAIPRDHSVLPSGHFAVRARTIGAISKAIR